MSILTKLAGEAVAAAPPLTAGDVHAAHAEFVWLTLQRFGVRASDLEDLLQEVFVVVHQRLHTYDGVARVTTWLYGICMRVASVHRRRAYVRREVSDDATACAEVAPEHERPDELAAAQQTRAQLGRVLDELDLERRAVLVMFEIEGLSCAEIAALTGAPLGTVYSRLGAARKDFARVLGREQARSGRGGAR